MNNSVIKVENLSKLYRLGEVGTGSLAHDINRWWHMLRGKEDPYSKLADLNDRTQSAGNSSYSWALRGVSLEVQRGDVFGIIGRNGAGKSTLLKILSRVTTQSSGQIKVKGRIASLLEVGTGFHPELTGRENIFLNGAILGMRKAEIARKFDEIVEFSGCARYIDTPVKRYSSGMYVRLAFAVAAHLEPEILIVDEVLAVGDAEFQKKCLGKMKDVAGHGRTILFVSHNMLAIQNLCNKGCVLGNGQLKYIGNISEAMDFYSKEEINSISGITNYDKNGSPLFHSQDKLSFITEFKILNLEKNEIHEIVSGNKFYFYFKFESHEKIEMALFVISINNLFGARISILSNIYTGEELNIEAGNNEMLCSADNFSLCPGDYLIDLKVYKKSSNIFNIENIFRLKVAESDFHGTGKIPDAEWGGIVQIKQKWSKA